MKRDMDLIREIMLKLEAWPMEMGDAVVMTPDELQPELPNYDLAQINHHMDLIHGSGFIDDGGSGSSQPMFGFVFMGLTTAGHDFLDTVRSPEVWRKTKEGASKAGTVGLQLLLEIAKAYAKQIAQERLGLHLP